MTVVQTCALPILEDSATTDSSPFAITGGGLVSVGFSSGQTKEFGVRGDIAIDSTPDSGGRGISYAIGRGDAGISNFYMAKIGFEPGGTANNIRENIVFYTKDGDFSSAALTAKFTVGYEGNATHTANSSSAALTVTQTGSGNAFVVEDSTSPDSTPFVIDANEIGRAHV